MDDVRDVMSPGSDSGYETAEQGSCEPPGVLEEDEHFKLNAKMAFVTYSRSQMDDKEEFFKCLKESLADSLPRVSATKKVAVEIFGSKEVHQDGTPHYHVVLRFSKKIHFRKAREKLFVWIIKDGQRVVDTESIYIRKKPAWESPSKFLQDVQAYVAKDGDVFGEWIGTQAPTTAEQDSIVRRINETESREEAEALIREHFPKKWAWSQMNVQALLRTKKPPPPQLYVPDFKVLPWREPVKMKQWRERNFPVRGGGRPRALVIVGPPYCGKSYWARSWGRPAVMDGRWDLDQLLQSDVTHVVLNDIRLQDFPYKQELAGCQVSITVTGKYRAEMTIPWGKPCIWTCNEENSVLRDPQLGVYLKKAGAVIVKLSKKLYIERQEDTL
ncbi:hypothetical protein HIM_11832 [Hirsutella minnesotensis 3608]|uniref:CRESS-DNA virus Rep endonuclease domain-containing protein n=1 Tax=Hirsutella minnesotensis 3608 TaxID=1043627 RepID=A0A0F7ZIQ0_9HYPO|nr:hypothetical protein HIM_11832 [Hirsutella minnesotensis 3608]